MRFTCSDGDFDSPLARWQYFEVTGGSRGRPIRVGRTLPYVQDIAASVAVAVDAHGIRERTQPVLVRRIPDVVADLPEARARRGWLDGIRSARCHGRRGPASNMCGSSRASQGTRSPIRVTAISRSRARRQVDREGSQGRGRPVVLNATVDCGRASRSGGPGDGALPGGRRGPPLPIGTADGRPSPPDRSRPAPGPSPTMRRWSCPSWDIAARMATLRTICTSC